MYQHTAFRPRDTVVNNENCLQRYTIREVVYHADGAKYKMYREGGGFHQEVLAKDFDKDFRLVTDQDNTFRKARVSCQTDKTYEGYVNDERWNGWAAPYLTFEGTKEFLSDLRSAKTITDYCFQEGDDGGTVVMFYNKDQGFDIEFEVIECTDSLIVDGKRVRAYNWNLGWCFEEEDNCPTCGRPFPSPND